MSLPKSRWHYLGVFLFFCFFFFTVHISTNFFFDPDSYYNIRHSAIIAENNFKPTVESWVKFHFLSYAPTDGYFLFHEILAIFIKGIGVIYGSKIFAGLGAASLFLVFYFLAAKITDKKRAFLSTLLLLLSSFNFTSRLFQIRAFPIMIAVTLLIYHFLKRKKYWTVAFLTFILTLFYNLSVILIFWGLTETLFIFLEKKYLNLKPLIAILFGILIGWIAHPFTFNQVNLIFSHIWQIPYLKSHNLFSSGGEEIQFQGFINFFSNNSLLIITYFLSIFLFTKNILKQKELIKYESTRLFLISFPWFIVSMFYVRGTEYFAPFAGLFCLQTYAYNQEWIKKQTQTFFQYLGQSQKAIKIILLSLLTIFFFFYCFLFFIDLRRPSQNRTIGYEYVNLYLKRQSPPESTVCYPSWDMFGYMFYFNQHNRYISAFDPVFTYNYNPELLLEIDKKFSVDKTCKKTNCGQAFLEEKWNDLPDFLYNQLDCQYFILSQNRYPLLTSYLKQHPETFTPLEYSTPTKDLKLFALKPR